jgi:hypothetical protein
VCAAAYAWGELGNNTCPENAERIGSAEKCQRAAIIMMKTAGLAGSEDLSYYPSGCFESGVNGFVYYNAHPVGAGYPHARPLCAVGTSPPSHSRAMCRAPLYDVLHAGCAGHRRAPTADLYRRTIAAQTRPFPRAHRARRMQVARARLEDHGRSCAAVWYPTTLPQHRSSARRASLAQVAAAAAAAARCRRQSRRYPMQQVRHCRTDPSL